MSNNDSNKSQTAPDDSPERVERTELREPGSEQLGETSSDAGADGSGAREHGQVPATSGQASVHQGGQDLRELEGEIVDQVTGRLIEVITASSSSMSSWTGPMPSPQVLREYQEIIPDAPERLLKIHESQTLGYSERQDKLVEAQISEAAAGRTAAVSLMVLCMIPSIVFFALGNTVAGCAFLSLPVLGFLKSLLPERNGNSGSSETK
ncbi:MULTISPECIES: hypothetical protein [Glutamicibacter]|uniref:hypothetical protein n=1 Tax=Glutamicibacter TaxID=1742989 RepID=UPI002580B126|nr:hypothetical protein [Glutamicibacter sp.]